MNGTIATHVGTNEITPNRLQLRGRRGGGRARTITGAATSIINTIVILMKRLVQKEVSLPDETAGKTEAVGEGSIRRAVWRFVVAALLVEPQRRVIDLVHVEKHLAYTVQ